MMVDAFQGQLLNAFQDPRQSGSQDKCLDVFQGRHHSVSQDQCLNAIQDLLQSVFQIYSLVLAKVDNKVS